MRKLWTGTTALIICVAICASGCATSRGAHVATPQAPPEGSATRLALTEFVQQLPTGTLVRVARTNGRTIRGTLVKGTSQSLFVQPQTRIPEAIIEVPMDQVLSVTPEPRRGNHIGRAIGAGAAAGAGAALAVFLVILAAFSD
jgi:hypothetical protein